MTMTEATRLVDILEADGLSSDKIVRAIRYIENGMQESPSKKEILAFLNKKDD
ncbi:MAG: hypothetical protein IJ679_03820 [Lachnospiraceae bacterium]|nr:hypothetical protein [Lachnospiraceae bacterium]